MSSYHTPVLLQACINHLQIKPSGTYVDLTFGGGGHSRAILSKLDENGRLIAFDQDEDAARNVPDDGRFTLVPENFRYLKKYLRLYGIASVHGILGDLGVSSHQFDEADRGFSIRFDGALDMRMNQKSPVSAKEVVNGYDEKELTRIFREYGEVSNAGMLARAIVESRARHVIGSTYELKQALSGCVPRFESNKYLAQVFQALRIEVNQEMDALRECLKQCVEVLVPGGRLVLISYHSLEDRMAKNVIRTGDPDGNEERDVIYGTIRKVMKVITSKPVLPDEQEIQENTRARSAKLRAGEKI